MKIILIYYIDDIKEGEEKNQKKTPAEFGKDVDLRIPLNWTMIRDNDISGRRFEDRTSIRVWTSI